MKSLIALSMHKAGSSIADLILVDFCMAKGFEIDRIAVHVPTSHLSEADFFQEYEKNLRFTGIYYGMARGPYVRNMVTIPQLKCIVQVRDPRDCLTSAYFSFSESHQPPKDPKKVQLFEERRRNLKELGIDEYVLNEAGDYGWRMQVLSNIIDRHDDVLVLKYEEMVAETEIWLGKISTFLEQPLTEKLRESLAEKIDFSVNTEDTSKHKRQVLPGDHQRKLKKETIVSVTNKLAGPLAKFGYT